jgi:hypothetical protein
MEIQNHVSTQSTFLFDLFYGAIINNDYYRTNLTLLVRAKSTIFIK